MSTYEKPVLRRIEMDLGQTLGSACKEGTGLSGRGSDTRLRRVVGDDRKIGVLRKCVKSQHQSESIRECEFLVDCLAELKFAVLIEPNGLVVDCSLGHQVTPVAGRDNPHVLRR